MKKITVVMLIAILAFSAVFMAGCGEKGTLEDYVNSDEEIQAEIQETADMYGFVIEVKENTITYTMKMEYEFTDEEKAEMVPQLEVAMDEMKDTFVEGANELKEAADVEQVNIMIVIQDAAGAELCSGTYQSE